MGYTTSTFAVTLPRLQWQGNREWTQLYCTTAMLPDQNGPDPLIYSANVEFGEVGGRVGLMASLVFNNIVRASGAHSYNWWIDGTEGSVWGTIVRSRSFVPMILAMCRRSSLRAHGLMMLSQGPAWRSDRPLPRTDASPR